MMRILYKFIIIGEVWVFKGVFFQWHSGLYHARTLTSINLL